LRPAGATSTLVLPSFAFVAVPLLADTESQLPPLAEAVQFKVCAQFPLVEMVIGRFPIPPPTRRELTKIFNVQPQEIQVDDGNVSDANGEDTSPKTMAIFELLDYIVNKPPPTLPRKVLSDEFVNFVGKCLKKNLSERANQTILMSDPFFKKHEALEDPTEFAAWVQSVIRIRHSQRGSV